MSRKTCILMVLVMFSLANTYAWLVSDCRSTLRLGVSSNLLYIRDSQMTSSSHLTSKHQAKYGRLFGNSAWCPGRSTSNGQIPESGAWLQIDLKILHIICSVVVQGTQDRWVTLYKLTYSTDGKKWMKERYFSTGNKDRDTRRNSYPYEPRIARYVRFNLANNQYHNWPCMRVELFGRKVFEFQPKFIMYYSRYNMHILVKPNGKENVDNRGNVRFVYVDQITKTPNHKLSTFDHYLSKNMDVYPDVPPRSTSLYAGSDILMVLPKNKYMKGKIVASRGTNRYEVTRSDNGKTEIFRRDYLRQKGLDVCELDNQCPHGTSCVLDDLGRPARYYCLCHKGSVEAFKGWPINMEPDCKDIDECSDDVCPINSKCINTPGSYHCNCTSGYLITRDNKCNDVDECAAKPSPCESGFSCHNSPGSYKCKDIDECLSKPCFGGENCINTRGSFRCEIPERKNERGETITSKPVNVMPTIRIIYGLTGPISTNMACKTYCSLQIVALLVLLSKLMQ